MFQRAGHRRGRHEWRWSAGFGRRLHYLWNSENDAPFAGLGLNSARPGQALHQNFAASYKVVKKARIGINGYAREQITDNKVKPSDTAKEGPKGYRASARPYAITAASRA